jgi:hypothetical protein
LKAGFPSFEIRENKNNVPISKSNLSSAPSKVCSSMRPEGPSVSALGDSKVNKQKQLVVKSDDVKSDKRKWALEVLARKAAVTSRKTRDELQEDNTELKGNYPLLVCNNLVSETGYCSCHLFIKFFFSDWCEQAQLPADMRPVLAPSRHNKIPLSVRQVCSHLLSPSSITKLGICPTTNGLNFFLGYSLSCFLV